VTLPKSLLPLYHAKFATPSPVKLNGALPNVVVFVLVIFRGVVVLDDCAYTLPLIKESTTSPTLLPMLFVKGMMDLL